MEDHLKCRLRKQYWSRFKDIKNINKVGNIIEREVTISADPQNSTSDQLVTIFPEQLKIQANLTEGMITGTRTLVLEPISENESRLKVLWDIDLSGIPIIGRGFADNGIKQNYRRCTWQDNTISRMIKLNF